MQYFCQFCSLTFRSTGHCWKMVTHCLVRATIPGQRQSSLSLYHVRSSLQGLRCWLLLQERLSQILLYVLCLTHQFTVPNTALCALSHTSVHSPSAHRSSASPLLQPHMPLGSHNRKKAFQNSVHKTYSGDLLDKYAVYFTEKKQCFTPQTLKTLHQPFLVKYRYYNPPSRKRSSSPGRPSIKERRLAQVLTSMLKVTQFRFQTHHLNHNCFSLCF